MEKKVAEILRAVQKTGDRALARYTRLFDRVRLTRSTMEVKPKEIGRWLRFRQKDAALRWRQGESRRFTAQLQKSWQYRDPIGMLLGQRITPLERVGVYVPGGKASYPSTVLMNAIPAKVAGVKEVIMTSPIGKDGAIILAAAKIAGVNRIFACRRRASDRCDGLRHRDDPESG